VEQDGIFIDDALLARNTQAFLRSPAGRSVLEEFDMPLLLCLTGGAMLACAGMCMLPTIIWTLAGLQALWSVARLEFLKPVWDNPARKPEQLVPLLGHGIIIGPDQKHALVVGTFQPSQSYSVDWLAKLAAWLGEVYSGDADDADAHPELSELLHDDTYRPYRRRPLPAQYAGEHKLYLFDVELDPQQAEETPYGTTLFAFAAEPGEKGEIAALPWSVARDAVRIAAN
jgi:hypothetical protein